MVVDVLPISGASSQVGVGSATSERTHEEEPFTEEQRIGILQQADIGFGHQPPKHYFKELAKQCAGVNKKYGNIANADDLRANLRMSCLPESLLDGEIPDYDDFLEERRKRMALKIKSWFEAL